MDAETSEDGSSVSTRIVPGADNSQAHIAISYVFSTTYVKILQSRGGNGCDECELKADDFLRRNSDGIRNLTALAVTDWARLRPPYNFTLSPSEAV